jgi:predicted ATPase/DNA-binding SARP family transcriptional activator
MGDRTEFRVLGPLQVVIDGEPEHLGGPRPRGLLAVLLVHAGEPVSAERLVDQLWGDEPPPTAGTALQVHLSALRKVLGDRLVRSASGYRLRVAPDELDASRFEAFVAAGALADALALWRGEPYAGAPLSPDIEAARHRLTELRLSTVEDWLAGELDAGRHHEILAELAGLVIDHPLRERLARLHMLALYRCGRAADALVAYAGYQDRLRHGLGAEPGTEIRALARAIDRGDPTIDRPAAVPTPASRFIGRRQELEDLARQLGETRLLTITGTGGVGKTRLALELVRDTAADHPGGVHFVELATLSPGSSIVEAVAGVLGVRARTPEPLLDALAARLRADRALLVLDNCEHVIESAAKVSAELLSHCSGLRILATSREPLGVPGELVRPLAGLVPSEATRLLADRGAAARPGFAIGGDNAAVAMRLTRRLDGLPLAIELAAAQLRSRSLEEVTERLDLADRRARTTPDRHSTMRAAIDWGFHLLAAEEQAMFSSLAVFAGGFGPSAAERITGQPGYLLTRLVDLSLLVVEPNPDGTRYHMLELIREYAAERLAELSAAGELRLRHARWFTELAEAMPTPGGEEHAAVLRRLDADVANLRAAVAWYLGTDPEAALRVAAPLWWYWWERGSMAEARAWLRAGLAARGPDPLPLHGFALRAAAALARNSGDFAEAAALGDECLATYRALDDQPGMIIALIGLCITKLSQRDYHAAVRYAGAARDLAGQVGDVVRRSAALNNLSIALIRLDRLAEARVAIEEALAGYQETGNRRGEADALANLGEAAERAGEPRASCTCGASRCTGSSTSTRGRWRSWRRSPGSRSPPTARPLGCGCWPSPSGSAPGSARRATTRTRSTGSGPPGRRPPRRLARGPPRSSRPPVSCAWTPSSASLWIFSRPLVGRSTVCRGGSGSKGGWRGGHGE